ncbi:gp54 [Brochothrix phage NF5]|nr:gp54 [Brochothrix phage NF5]ADH03076.1 gp54 [Brochothrix phage NF5]
MQSFVSIDLKQQLSIFKHSLICNRKAYLLLKVCFFVGIFIRGR